MATTALDDWLRRRRTGSTLLNQDDTPQLNSTLPPPDTDPTNRDPDPSGGQVGIPGGPPSVWGMWPQIQAGFARAQGNADTADDWWAGRETDVHSLYDKATGYWGADRVNQAFASDYINPAKPYLAAMEALQAQGWKPYYDRTGSGETAKHFRIPGWDYGFEDALKLPGEVDYNTPGYVYT